MNSDVLIFSAILCQFLLVGTLVARELLRKYRRNFVSILFYSVLILFVYCQELAIWRTIQESGSVAIFNNWITPEGFTLACFLLTVSAIVIFATNLYATEIYARKLRRKLKARAKRLSQSSSTLQNHCNNTDCPRQNLYSYLITSSLLVVVMSALVYLLGGIGLLVQNLGTSVGGQTVLLIALQIGKMPLYYKLAARRKPKFMDWVLFIMAILLTLVNSRRLAVTGVLQYAMLYNYCIAEIPIRSLIRFFLLSVLFAIGYGSIREFTNFYDSFHLDNLYDFYSDFDFLTFFFEKNVEGFSGFGGIISEYLSRTINFDFGVSNLKLIVQLIPNSIREEFAGDFLSLIESAYPYDGSVVPSGFEASFAHFSFFGVFLFSALLGFFPVILNFKLLSGQRNRIEYMFAALQGFTLIGGQVWLYGFFTLGDLAIARIYKLIVKLTQTRNKSLKVHHLSLPAQLEDSNVTR